MQFRGVFSKMPRSGTMVPHSLLSVVLHREGNKDPPVVTYASCMHAWLPMQMLWLMHGTAWQAVYKLIAYIECSKALVHH